MLVSEPYNLLIIVSGEFSAFFLAHTEHGKRSGHHQRWPFLCKESGKRERVAPTN